MALAMLYLYERGYRNFLFFVSSNNIVEKTRDNFLNSSSSKYLFAPILTIEGRKVEVKEVKNFQGTASDSINLCLTTIQGLHADLTAEKENAVTLIKSAGIVHFEGKDNACFVTVNCTRMVLFQMSYSSG